MSIYRFKERVEAFQITPDNLDDIRNALPSDFAMTNPRGGDLKRYVVRVIKTDAIVSFSACCGDYILIRKTGEVQTLSAITFGERYEAAT